VDSQQFLILNFVILAFFIVWFLTGRRSAQKKPTTLDMKRGNESQARITNESSELLDRSASGRYSHPKYQKFLDSGESDMNGPQAFKELNILFNYNGHTWDAYEVLGVPAGSNLVDVTRAYQGMLKKADPESHVFLETAFRAILAKK
jgi:hypothetical protein